MIFEVKFAELLLSGDRVAAVRCLQREVSPVAPSSDRVHYLASLVAMKGPGEVLAAFNVRDAADLRSNLVLEVVRVLSPAMVVQPHRLHHLLDQVSHSFDMFPLTFRRVSSKGSRLAF
jgi:hypothetical protein